MGLMPSFGAARDFFCAECELDHICPRRDRPLCSSPDGVSQFQCPGLARALAVYCADGLVFSVPVSSETPPASAPDTRRPVICLNAPPYQARKSTMSAGPC